jgi:predicted phage terminase large subunit-like protein
MIKASWLGRYDNLPQAPTFRRIVLSCDPAGKAHAHNDFTAVTVCGVDGKSIHVLHATRGHWTVMQMKDRIIHLAAQWKADLILVEDTSSGMGLIQLLREQPRLNVIGRRPSADKETRMARHQGRFEAGRVWLPKEASWLAEFESELLAFPNGRYDDQVDALLQVLDWYSQNESYINPIMAAPIIITRADLGLPPVNIDWSCRF